MFTKYSKNHQNTRWNITNRRQRPTLKPIYENYSLLFYHKITENFTIIIHWFFEWKSAHFISLTGLQMVEKSHFWMILNLEEITKTKNGSVKGYILRLGLYNSWWPGQPKSASSICKHLLQQIKTLHFWAIFSRQITRELLDGDVFSSKWGQNHPRRLGFYFLKKFGRESWPPRLLPY